MTSALATAAAVFLAILVAQRVPLLGGLIAMFPLKAVAVLAAVPERELLGGLLAGAAASVVFVAVMYLFSANAWSFTAATLLWAAAAFGVSKLLLP